MDVPLVQSGYKQHPTQMKLGSIHSNFAASSFELLVMRLIIAVSLFLTTLHAQDRVPVLIELFTSEGCSSCPPADTLLAELQSTHPAPNIDVIVLSEHVDYWDYLGWKDPFSAKTFTQRQQMYARIEGNGDVYTPEAVIDGRFSTVGSNRPNLLKALTASGANPKFPLNLSITKYAGALQIEAPNRENGDLWIAIAQDKAVSRVEHGENAGRTLTHVGVVRSLTKVKGNQARIAIDPSWPANLKLVAFVQDPSTGRILQLTQQSL